MAPPGKSRSKRSTSTYSSTLTTVGFITLCVLGVWMLTSDSIIPPQPTDDDTATVVDNLAIKSTDQNPNFDDNINQPREEETIQIQPQPENNKDEPRPQPQAQTETHIVDQNGEANAGAITDHTSENHQSAGNENQDHVDQSKQNQDQETRESTETGGKLNSDEGSEHMSDQDLQKQQQQKLEAEKEQRQREEAETQQQLDEAEEQLQKQQLLDQAEQQRQQQILDQAERQQQQKQIDQVEQQIQKQEQIDQADQQLQQKQMDQAEQKVQQEQLDQTEQQLPQQQQQLPLDEEQQQRQQQQQLPLDEEQQQRQQQQQLPLDEEQQQQLPQQQQQLPDQIDQQQLPDQTEQQQQRPDQTEQQQPDQTEQLQQQQQQAEQLQQQQQAEQQQNQLEEAEQQKQQEQAEQQKQQEQAEQQKQQEQAKLNEQKIDETVAQIATEEHQRLHNVHPNVIPGEDQQTKQQEPRQQQQQQQQQLPEQQQPQQQRQQQPDQIPDQKPDVHEFPDETNNPETKQQPENTQQADIQEAKPKIDEANSAAAGGGDTFPGGDSSGIPKESKESKKSWSTQETQSENQNERHASKGKEGMYGYTWQMCNETTGPDYIPCLDNIRALKKLHSTKHFQHRERHCPQNPPTCLVPLPDGYKTPILWPQSRDKIWYHNVPHTKLAEVKGHQNWVKVNGEFLTFPGGGTQFIHGAMHYINFVQNAVPDIAWGKHTRVVLDVGCGVASFGGYLFEKNVLTMSFAPKDEHEAQVQFALERGIPAISAVMGSKRLPFPSRVFDLIHCARCRVPWHAENGRLLLELNRVLRPGGYFVWSATPVYQKKPEDVEIWKAMTAITQYMCWEQVTIRKDKINKVAAAIYRKPRTNACYDQRKHKSPPMCKNDDDPNAAWYVPLQSCMHWVPVESNERGTKWPEPWPIRVQTPPYWLNSSQMGIYGKPAPQDFARDYLHWKRVVDRTYLKGLGIDWSTVRNVMDMRAVYGGFAAALKDVKVWVLNVVNTDSADTLPIIYERGLFGIYHDWCESFSSYPRTYDLLHADHLFSRIKKRCKVPPLMVEIDRLVRPGGKLIVRDESDAIGEVENLLKSLHWEVHLIFSKNQEGLLSAQKTDWRPDTYVSK